MKHTFARLTVAVGFLIDIGHHLTRKFVTMTANGYSLILTALDGMANVAVCPFCRATGRAFAVEIIPAD